MSHRSAQDRMAVKSSLPVFFAQIKVRVEVFSFLELYWSDSRRDCT